MRIITWFIYIITLFLLLPSCSNEEIGTDDPRDDNGKDLNVSFLVNTIGTRGGSTSPVQEKVRSLRIIMISDGFIEYNTKIDLEEGSVSDADENPSFPYLFNRSTVPGNKKFYLIANEETVNSVSFETENNLPSGIVEGMSLSSILNSFSRDKLPAEGTFGYSTSGKGNQLETVLNSAYFNINYEISNGTVYLPYSAYYDGIVSTEDASQTIRETMYIVPVATKFTVCLNNYRKEKVRIEKLNLSKFHDSNFLMAHLDDSEKTKTFAGRSYPWIEWLKIVSDGSNSAADIEAFNQSAGWIEKYLIPENAELNMRVRRAGADEDWTIEKLVNLENPSILPIVTYLPESKNIVTKQVYNNSTKEYEDKTYQAYYLQIFAKDENAEEIAESEILEIDAVKALFRNTHVVVDIDIYDSMVDIYCQIQPWEYSSFKGYLQEVDDD